MATAKPKVQPSPTKFKIPDVLYEDIVTGQCVIFAGAGISTEGGIYSKPTFYETIKKKSEYPEELEPPSFPDLMQYFCDHVDGGQRNRLIREAISRIEMFTGTNDINILSTGFHHVLASLPYFNRIVTTNWDPFLERSLNILVTMVEDRDLAFWNDSKRQVLKIHGCITRPYTLIATRDDYEACINRNPLIFNKLRDLMATKTFIFVGYSLRDSDFELIWKEITASLGQFRKLAYAIDPQATEEAKDYWSKNGIRVITAYGIGFLDALHKRLLAEDLVPSDKLLLHFANEMKRLLTAKRTIREKRDNSNGAFASAMYQDGLKHALQDVISGVTQGKTKDEFERDLAGTQKELERVWNAMDLIEIAYESGWYEVLQRFCQRDDSPIPVYFHPDKLKPTHRYIKG